MALSLWLNISPESQNHYIWRSHNSPPNHNQSTQLSISHKRGEQQFIKLLIPSHRSWIPKETKFQNLVPFCSLIRGCCLSIAQLCRGLISWLMLSQWQELHPLHWNCPGNDWCYLLRIIINSITEPQRLEGTVGLILSNLLLQPESD